MLVLELFNNMTPALYHGTSVDRAAKILYTNRIKSDLWHNALTEQKTVSLTRSFSFAYRFSKEQVVFELDAVKLRQKYKIFPVDYYRGNTEGGLTAWNARRTEAEEACVGDIFPLSTYLTAIHMNFKEYRWCENHDENLIEGHKDYKDLLNHPLLKVMHSRPLTKAEKLQSHADNLRLR